MLIATNTSWLPTPRPSVETLYSYVNESTLFQYPNNTVYPSVHLHTLFGDNNRTITAGTVNVTAGPTHSPSISHLTEGPTTSPSVITTKMPSSSPTIVERTRMPTRHSWNPTISTKTHNFTLINETRASNHSSVIFDGSSVGGPSRSDTSTEVALIIIGGVVAAFLLIALVHFWMSRGMAYSAIPKQVVADTREDSITDTLRRLRTSDWMELTPEQIDDMFPERSPTRSRANSQPVTYEVDEKELLDRESNSPFV